MSNFLALQELEAADLNAHFPLRARKTSDESVSSASTGTTLQNDDHLFLSVAASTTYEMILRLIVNSGTTPDFKLGWTFPSGLTMSYDTLEAVGSGVSGAAISPPIIQTATPAFSCFGSDQIIRASGLVIVGATAGTLQLQWAQNTSDAGNTTVKTNSYLILQKV